MQSPKFDEKRASPPTTQSNDCQHCGTTIALTERFVVRAVHKDPAFPPIVEPSLSASGASIRAGRLYMLGYSVEVARQRPDD